MAMYENCGLSQAQNSTIFGLKKKKKSEEESQRKTVLQMSYTKGLNSPNF